MPRTLTDYQAHHRSHKKQLFQGQPIISDQIDKDALAVIWETLAATLTAGVVGDIVEFGCYIGTTSLYVRRLLDSFNQSASRALHVYDSFRGLPEKTAQDASGSGSQFQAGELAVSKQALLAQFHKAGLAPPIIHKAWFEDLGDADIPNQIAFAFLDGDFYQSIITSLELVWPRLRSGGVVVVDDYQREALPGVERAINDFFQQTGQVTVHRMHNLAIIRAL